jgi:pimeloyl-ACP methyl ester carboxylesterase
VTLEVLDKGQASTAHPIPLLFVHGAFHGAWCWDEHFLDFFADTGYRVLALNLRGHGNSPQEGSLNSCSVHDYVDDVRSVAAVLPTAPVLIGHSMGGFVVQKYLAEFAAPAAVLVASAPPNGILRTAVRILCQHPVHSAKARAFRRPLRLFGRLPMSRALFFHPGTPEELVVRYTARLQDESLRVMYRDLTFAELAEPARVTAPVLVLGAEFDGFFSRKEVEATATAYSTLAEFFPAMGHNMMLECGWKSVALRIDSWLGQREL